MDKALEQGASQKDVQRFWEYLLEKIFPIIYTTVCSRFPENADEYTYEVIEKKFLKISIEVYRRKMVYLIPFVLRTTINYCNTIHSRLKKKTERQVPMEDAFGNHQAVYDPTRKVENGMDINAALASIPNMQAKAFILHHVEGYTYEEIAAQLGKTKGAVSQLMVRAKKNLRNFFDDCYI